MSISHLAISQYIQNIHKPNEEKLKELVIRVYLDTEADTFQILAPLFNVSHAEINKIIRTNFHEDDEISHLLRKIIIRKRAGFDDDHLTLFLDTDGEAIELARQIYSDFRKKYNLSMDIDSWKEPR